MDAATGFHERTMLQPYSEETDAARTLPPIRRESALAWVPLPSVHRWPAMSVEEAIISRRTSRSFDPWTSMPLDMLSRLLVLSCGRTTPVLEAAFPSFRRAAPSAGATYPIDTYLVALRVDGILPGTYAYSVDSHALGLLRRGQLANDIVAWSLGQLWIGRAAVVFGLVGVLPRVQERYASRGYRYMLFEAGHIAQNLYLLGSAYGLSVQATGGFMDTSMNYLFGLEEHTQQALYLVAVGPGGGG